MSLYEVVAKSIYAGQQCVNRWNYIGSGTPAAVSLSFGLASALGYVASGSPAGYPADTILQGIRDITSNLCVFNEIIVMNVYDPVDFYTTALLPNYAGAAPSDARAPFEALGFRTNIVNRSIGRGTKRFVAPPSNMLGASGSINPALLELMQDLADKMSAPVTYDDEGNTLSYLPCIVSKVDYVTPSGKKAYRYYPTLSEQMTHVAQGIRWEIYNTVRSQVSRQLGQGA